MLQGSLVALITPMHADGAVDWETLERLLVEQVEAGTHGVVLLGSTGEGWSFSDAERKPLIRHAASVLRHRVPLVVGAGLSSTCDTVACCQAAQSCGADACMVSTPPYNRPTQEGLYRHYHTLAQAMSLPVVLYNVPSRTGVDLWPETAARLSRLDTVIGLKEAVATVDRMRALQALLDPSDMVWFSGDDPTAPQAMQHGAQGVVSVLANAVPRQVAQLWVDAQNGRWEAVQAVNERLQPLHQAMTWAPNPIPIKAVLHSMGRVRAGMRLPLLPLEAQHHQALQQAMALCGLPVMVPP